jgi:hypothetical protein
LKEQEEFKTNMPDMVAQLWPEIEASIVTVKGE